MCGIAGIFALGGNSVPLGGIAAMNAAMRRRGPDDEGVAFFSARGEERAVLAGPGTAADSRLAEFPYAPKEEFQGDVPPWAGVALGHRRLSIVDLSPAGHQPLCSANGRYWIVYNGEIYNHAEVGERLAERGVTLRTRCDTEAVVEAYAQWGADCLDMFNGMFAFAVWDDRDKRLFCARDRMGIKPLFYTVSGGAFVFASSIAALAASGLYQPEPDWQGVYHAVSFHCAPRPMTCFKGVRALRQGHWMTVDSDGTERTRQWWGLPQGPPEEGRSMASWTEELEDTLTRAVSRRLVSDRPVGVCMSGGVDSTTIAALCAQKHDGIRAFTLDYGAGGEAYDELPQARATAAMWPMRHVISRVDQDDLLKGVREMVRTLEEPYHQIHPGMLIHAAVAQTDVTVIMDGTGGDELFCGYGRERTIGLWRRLGAVSPLVSLLPSFAGKRVRSLKELASLKNLSDAYLFNFSMMPETFKRHLFPSRLVPHRDSFAAFREFYGWDEARFADDIDGICRMDMVNYIGNHHMYRGDQLTMRHSLEGRFPYLDHEVVELACRIPSRFKAEGGVGKLVLREVAKKHIHPSCLAMGKKGFSAPMGDWLRGPLKDLLHEKTRALAERGLLDARAIRDTVGFFERTGRYAHRAWYLAHLEMWLEEFIDVGSGTQEVAA